MVEGTTRGRVDARLDLHVVEGDLPEHGYGEARVAGVPEEGHDSASLSSRS